MASKLIDNIIDESAIKKQLDKLNSELSKTRNSLGECAVAAKGFSDAFSKAGSILEMTNLIAKYNKVVDESQKLQQEISRKSAELAKAESDLIKVEVTRATITEKKSAADKKAAQEAEKAAAAEKLLSDGEKTLISTLEKCNISVEKLNVSKNEARKVSTLINTLNNSEKTSYEHLSAQYQINLMAYHKLSEAQRDTSAGKAMQKSINDMNSSLKQNDASVGNFHRSVGDYKNQILNALGANNGFIGNLANMALGAEAAGTSFKTVGTEGVKSFGTALKELALNPIIAVIAAVAAAVLLVKTAITSNGEAMNTLNQIIAPFKEILNTLLTILGQVVSAILQGVLAVEKFGNAILSVIPGMEKMAEKNKEAIELEQEKQRLAADIRADVLRDAKDELKIAEDRNKSRQKDKYSIQERLNFLKEADAMELSLAKNHAEFATRQFELKKKQMAQEGKAFKDLTKDEKDAFINMEADIYRAQAEYYQRTIRLKSQEASLIQDDQAEKEEANRKAKEAADKRLEIANKNAKANKDIIAIHLNEEIKALQLIADDDKKSSSERYNALVEIENKKKKLLENEAAYEVRTGKLTAKERKAIWVQLAADERALKQSTQTEIEKINKEELTDLLDGYKTALDETTSSLEKDKSEKLALLSQAYSNGTIKEEEYQKGKEDIALEYSKLQYDATLDELNKELELSKLNKKQQEAIKRSIVDTQNKYTVESNNIAIKANEDAVKKAKEAADKQKEIEQSLTEAKKKLNQQLFNTLNAFGEAYYTNELNRVTKLKDRNTAAAEKATADIEKKVASGVMSEAEGDAQTKAIEEQKQAREDALTAKENKVKTEQAKYERMSSLFNIAISTAESVMKIKAEAHVLEANPATALLAPIALAQVPLVIATGAAESAAVLAEPLPTYAKGTNYHPGGLALWGETHKSEMGITPSGDIIKSPAFPTVVNLPKGTKVIPDYEKAIQEMAFNASVNYMDENSHNLDFDAYNDSIIRSKIDLLLTQGANQLNKLEKLNYLKKLDRLGEKLDALKSIDGSLRSMKKNPWVH